MTMRFLIVDHYYSAAEDWIYGRDPGLRRAPYELQLAGVHDALFGETAFEVRALQELGFEASDCLINVRPLQDAWAAEHGTRLRGSRPGIRLRRGWIPWISRSGSSWMAEALLGQIRHLKPDVVHVQAMGLVPNTLVRKMREEAKLVVGQIASDVPAGIDLHAYSLIVSSIPNLVQRFRRGGIDAELLALAFERSLVDVVGPQNRDIPVSFVGSISPSHTSRLALLEAVAKVAPLEVWTADTNSIRPGSAIRAGLHEQAFGRDMYEVLARSRIALNNHARIAAGDANNLRLFEATGMGALLITEEAPNLGELFEVGREVVTYKDAADAARLVHYYLDHPTEAAAIAEAGQARTLRDHTWRARMERLAGLAASRV